MSIHMSMHVFIHMSMHVSIHMSLYMSLPTRPEDYNLLCHAMKHAALQNYVDKDSLKKTL